MKTVLTTSYNQHAKGLCQFFVYLLPGIIAYAPVQIFLSLVTLSKLFNDFPASADLHPGDALCHYDRNIQSGGWSIGSIAVISNVAFTAKMLYNLNNKGTRTKLNKLIILFQCLTLGIASASMNGDNAYEASRYFFYRCDDTQNTSGSALVPLLTITASSVLFSAISKAIAFTDEVQPYLNLALIAAHKISCYEQSTESLQRLRLEIIFNHTALNKLDKVTADSEIKSKKVAFNLIMLTSMTALSFRYICFSYLEFGTRPTTQLIHYLNQTTRWDINQSSSDTMANTMGLMSWSYNSVVTAILLANTIFTPHRPDFMATALSSKISMIVGVLAIVNSLPLFIIPFLQTSLDQTDQIITAITMVLGNFVTAWIGLADTISEWNDPEYKSRDEKINRRIEEIVASSSPNTSLLLEAERPRV